MKSEKIRLTKIIKIIAEKFPEGNDIYGYQGITKSKIVKSLEQIYSLFSLIESFEEEIETVWLKRRIAKRFDEIQVLLKEIDSEKWLDLFDKLLETITKTRIETKDVYITLSDNPLRNEMILDEIKKHAEELNEVIEDVKANIEIIESGSEKSEKLVESLEGLKIELEKTDEQGKTILNRIIEIEKTATESNETIEEVTPELESTLAQSKDIYKNVLLNDEKFQSLLVHLKKGLLLLVKHKIS